MPSGSFGPSGAGDGGEEAHAVLSFVEHQSDAKTQDESFGVRVSVKSGGEATNALTGRPLATDEQRVFADYQQEIDDWCADLRLRRKLARKVAGRRLKAPKRTPAPALAAAASAKVAAPVLVGGPSAKVGWNEPCPCGSGCKFKKCCA